MKKNVLLLMLFVLGTAGMALAGNGDLFQYDKQKVKSEMAELTKLENMLVQDQSLGYKDLLESKNSVALALNTDSFLMTPGMISGPVIPAFWWGCLLGPVGVLIVYVVEDDPSQTKSAFWGCVIAVLVSGAGYGLFGYF